MRYFIIVIFVFSFLHADIYQDKLCQMYYPSHWTVKKISNGKYEASPKSKDPLTKAEIVVRKIDSLEKFDETTCREMVSLVLLSDTYEKAKKHKMKIEVTRRNQISLLGENALETKLKIEKSNGQIVNKHLYVLQSKGYTIAFVLMYPNVRHKQKILEKLVNSFKLKS